MQIKIEANGVTIKEFEVNDYTLEDALSDVNDTIKSFGAQEILDEDDDRI